MQCPSCQAEVDSSQRFCKGCGAPLPVQVAVDPLVDRVIGGKYKIIKLLGEGGMGAVYHGEQSLGTNVRKVAIKTLHQQLSKDATVQARFQRECGTVAALEHPNTIQVFDFGTTDDGQLYIVMEFVKGKSLADAIEKEGAMSSARAEAIMKQICGSLEEAHAQGVVHRDLKPENVVLTKRAGKVDFVKVLDFGIAKRSGEEDKKEQKLTQQGMVLGTPPYMSPEQFTGRPIDARSDIYSLGVMAYEMLTAKLPFEAETAFEWATKHMTVEPTPIESQEAGLRAPEKMRQAVMRALSKHVEDRFQTVKDFFDAFSVDPAAAEALTRAGATTSPTSSSEVAKVTISTGAEPVSMRAPTQASDSMSAAPAEAPRAQSGGTAILGAASGARAGGAPPQESGGQRMAGVPPGGGAAYAPGPMAMAPAATASTGKASGGGGAGKSIALALLALLLVGGAVFGVLLYMRHAREAAAQAQSTDVDAGAAVAVGTAASSQDPSAQADAGAAVATSTDAVDAAVAAPDAGVDAGKKPAYDAGHAAVVPSVPTVDPSASIPACANAAAEKKAGNMATYQALAQICRQRGGVVPQ